MGIKTVAIYSTADSHSLHVQMADEAYCVGPPPSNQSYLNIDSILNVLKLSDAKAVHPGYGFLSENYHFCQALTKHNIEFIGPSYDAISKMGDKIESKIIAKKAGVNIIPGFDGVVKNIKEAKEIARKIGYPVMIKASAGGGGKGMRIAWNEKDVEENFTIAATESKASFGDDRLLLEKYIEDPRHIEIQLIGDKHGNILYLPERECSIQRRNQKVIEEAPSMAINEETRKAMGQQAVQLAKHVGYYSAGTVEFLVDKHQKFYFLEMNTRLQVEHPITEYVSGLDLVEQMINVAAGHKLQIAQSDLKINGWAFESRVYAEDSKLFLPAIGKLHVYKEPLVAGDAGIRCDSGIKEGSEISIYYDPLICKLCTHATSRDDAILKMKTALDSYVIRGVTHNIPLLRQVFSQNRFKQGKITTKYLAEEFPKGFDGHQLTEKQRRDISIIALKIHQEMSLKMIEHGGNHIDEEYCITINDEKQNKVKIISENGILFHHDNGKNFKIDVALQELSTFYIRKFRIDSEEPIIVQYHECPFEGSLLLQAWGSKYVCRVETNFENQLSSLMTKKSLQSDDYVIKAPMPGQMISVAVKEGDMVREGAELGIIEAMKMQNVIRSPKAGKIIKISAKTGENVGSEQILFEFSKDP